MTEEEFVQKTIESQTNVIRAFFHATALNTAANNSGIPIAQNLKRKANLFMDEYRKYAMPTLERGGEENAKMRIAIIEGLADACMSVAPERYALAIAVLQAVNEGKFDQKTEGNDTQN